MKWVIDKVLPALSIMAIVAAITVIWDFNNVKSEVHANRDQLSVVSQIVCKYAIKDNLTDAAEICAEVLKRSKHE